MATKASTSEVITIQQVSHAIEHFRLVGTTPLYSHRLSQKARQMLLVGGRKKTAVEKLEIKHHPEREFRSSMDVQRDGHEHSAVFFPAMAFKSAMATAALELPGVKATQVKRLVFLPADRVPIFGYPVLKMDVTRSADMNKTPDIRTRAFFREWATEIEIRYVTPQLSRSSVLALIHNAGIIAGVGDFRQERGKGSYGAFRIADPDEDLSHLMDKERQIDCIDNPRAADSETVELMNDYRAEVEKRK